MNSHSSTSSYHLCLFTELPDLFVPISSSLNAGAQLFGGVNEMMHIHRTGSTELTSENVT